MVANPVLEELPDEVPLLEDVEKKTTAEKPAEPPADTGVVAGDNHDSFQEIDFGSFFENYLDPGFRSPEAEVVEKPSFENFLSQPASLSDHLEWQLSLSISSDAVREAGQSIIGNLNEDGYLTATLEEIAQSGGHTLEDVHAA